MKQAKVVIGANFGDEGKGLVTDYLSASYGEDAMVVRFNGGAQAAHTVQIEDGTRHVFHHIGSGSMVGAATYLSRFFVCNPVVFAQEYQALQALKRQPRIVVSPQARVTTPYDMMINQMIEDHRGNKRHGSCGLGFGETIERNLTPGLALDVAGAQDRDSLIRTLKHIREEWVPKRLFALGLEAIPPEWQARLESDDVLEWYLEELSAFLDRVEVATEDVLCTSRQVIFEGAQGLLLDQNGRWFPHVTRSNTGVQNAAEVARAAGIESLDVTYVTRSYLTRHGAGPLPCETKNLPYPRIEDKTNVPNRYQGSLRFGWLHLDILRESILEDLRKNRGGITLTHNVAVTCMDHIDDKVTFMSDGALRSVSQEDFLNTVLKATGAQGLLRSAGPTRHDVTTVGAGALV